MLEFKKTLIVAAHPDDEVLGVGGVIPLIKAAGDTVTVLVVTDGSCSQYEDNEDMFLRKQEQMLKANEILGTDEVIQWDFPDMLLDSVNHVDLTRKLSAFVGDRSFDTIFFHAENDLNLDHRIIYHAVLVAARPVATCSVKNLLCYHVNSSSEWGGRSRNTLFLPNYYVDISETIEIKLKALAAYVDELREYPHPRSLIAVENRAKVFGAEAGYDSAEAFNFVFSRVSHHNGQ